MVSVKIKEKNAISAPVIIAPITLVATKVIAKSITDVKIAPKIPVKRTDRIGQTHPLMFVPDKFAETAKTTARYTTATPKTTHKNAGVTVITAVVLKIAAIIPTIMLPTIANIEQFVLQVQIDIFFTS